MNLIGNINAIPFRRFRGGGGVAPFPSIPGMIARYSALGLTNEQMAANPVWKDLTGNGHDLQMKNFAWGGMSGVGGYKYNFLSNDWLVDGNQSSVALSHKIVIINKKTSIQLVKLIRNELENTVNITLKITGLEANGSSFKIYDNVGSSHAQEYNKDGIYQINYTATEGANRIYFYVLGGNMGQLENPITIEQLPLYPGFILGDGVNDFAVTENNLDLEDTYTIYTPLILLKYGGVVCGKNSDKDFSLNTVIYSKSIGFDSANVWSGSIPVDLFEFVLVACKRSPQTMYVKDLVTGKSNQNKSKEFVPNPRKYFVWRNVGGSWCQVAIAGQIICNGYYSTDEDDEKVLDWYKKQYPWLFFDQAWTVVGKTNEDEDRATIANITGNGNDLVLSNFGFAEGSGYGLYKQNFTKIQWTSPSSRVEVTKTNSSFNITNVKNITIQVYYLSKINEVAFTVPSIKVRVTGLTDGQTINYRYFVNGAINGFLIPSDGIYNLPEFEFPAKGDYYGFNLTKVQSSCNITIEQIPEYEGYLVTDGVDDRVGSSTFTFNKDWTIVGNWTMLSNIPSNCGIIKASSIFLYNSLDGVTIYFAGGPIKIQSKSINAFCSDGRIYLNDWTEILKPDVQIASGGSKSSLNIASYSANFTKMAFKNLAIYDGKNLSKDDCIKAYNYLQTLKAK